MHRKMDHVYLLAQTDMANLPAARKAKHVTMKVTQDRVVLTTRAIAHLVNMLVVVQLVTTQKKWSVAQDIKVPRFALTIIRVAQWKLIRPWFAALQNRYAWTNGHRHGPVIRCPHVVTVWTAHTTQSVKMVKWVEHRWGYYLAARVRHAAGGFMDIPVVDATTFNIAATQQIRTSGDASTTKLPLTAPLVHSRNALKIKSV